MSVPAYPSYRESGVDGLGQVPDHWAVAPAKYSMTARSGGASIKGECADAPDEGLYQGYSASGPNVWLPDFEHDGPGLVLSAVGARCGKVFKADGKWGVVANTHCLIPRGESCRDFLWYLTNDESWWEKGGTAQPFVKVPDSLVRKIALPPPEEQAAIVAFLDRETAKIDLLVEEQRRLVELLKEKRQAVISHAVTKGLDPTVPMKDSGVEWLGEVPAQWRLSRVKYAASHVVDCLHTTPTYDGELAYPAVRTADIERGRVLLEQVRLVSRDVYEDRIQRLAPQANDILYTREGERFGLAALVPPGVDLCLGQRMMMLRMNDSFDPAYVMWVLNSDAVYQQVVAGIAGAMAPHVNISEVINFHLPVPPIDEQKRLGAQIERAVGSLDSLATEAQSAITLLQERRSALISAAITGKIDVRGLVARETEAA